MSEMEWLNGKTGASCQPRMSALKLVALLYGSATANGKLSLCQIERYEDTQTEKEGEIRKMEQKDEGG